MYRHLISALRSIAGNIKTVVDFHDYRSGEHFFTIKAYQDDRLVGKIDGSLYEGVVWVKYIEVASDVRGQGVGRSLMQSLLKEFPDEQIDMGYTTSEGERLRKYIPDDRVYKE